jgi:DNA-binding transcriptional LysR family regulator
MEFRQVTAFLAVAEELHFGRAAERLRIAQPALSQMIRALEADLDVDLFERTTRRVRLTPAGEALLEPAAAIGTQVDGARRIARAAQQGLAGRVRIGFGGTSGYSILSRLAREVGERHPGISLDLRRRCTADRRPTLCVMDRSISPSSVPRRRPVSRSTSSVRRA